MDNGEFDRSSRHGRWEAGGDNEDDDGGQDGVVRRLDGTEKEERENKERDKTGQWILLPVGHTAKNCESAATVCY